jgi:hypothetical protein
MDKVTSFSSLGILIAVGLGFGWSLQHRPATSEPHDRTDVSMSVDSTSSATATSPQPPTRSVRKNTTSTATNQPHSEIELMAELRSLNGAAPLIALRLAREGNERFPKSTDAPERTWHVIKSLTDLGQFGEAREEALRMVETYPPSHWTMDIHRHVISHPPGPPQ